MLNHDSGWQCLIGLIKRVSIENSGSTKKGLPLRGRPFIVEAIMHSQAGAASPLLMVLGSLLPFVEPILDPLANVA